MASQRRRVVRALSVMVVVGMTTGFGATVASAASTTVNVAGASASTDTGVALTAGETFSISATGTIFIGNTGTPNSGNEYPAGSGVVSADGLHCSAPGAAPVESVPFLLPGAPCWSLIADIGGGSFFEIGASGSFVAPSTGELFLAPNDNAFGDNSGSWSAQITTPSPPSILTITSGVDPATANATSAAGAPVSFVTPTASDPSGPVPVSCDATSGAVFPIGQTAVTCTASQSGDTPPSVQTTLTVTVIDATLAITHGVNPAPVPVATSTSSAPVGFVTPTATDLRGTVPVTCTRTSGSWFGVGPTIVTCSATRAGDVPSIVTTSLTVVVYVPAAMPDPPAIGTVTPGINAATVPFGPPTYNGSSVVTGYAVACTSSDGGAGGSASGQYSPLTVSGLTNGKTYSCTATATNAVGTSQPSNASNTFVPNSGSATCTNTSVCDATIASPITPQNPLTKVEVTGTPTDPIGSVDVDTAPAPLNCPGVPPAVTAVTTLNDAGFPSASNLTATVTQFAVATGPGLVCFSSDIPFLSVTHPTIPTAGTFILLQCSAVGNLAPCQLSSTQTNSSLVVKILIAGGDPVFKVVEATGRLVWPSSFPTGKVGAAYSGHLQSSGGKAPFHWKVSSGTLAPGLTLNASSGAVTGKPTKKGVFTCVVRVTDSEAKPQSANINVSITIK